MEQIYANNFSVGTIENTVYLTIRTMVPMYNAVGRSGNEIAKEVVVIMTPDAYFGLKDMLLKAEKSGVSETDESEIVEETEDK